MLAERIAKLITPAIEAMGFDLVRVQVSGSQRPTLQIMAEPVSGRAMSVDDCAEISRAISAVLDVEDPIAGAYSLEVSSPGIDRPLTRHSDYSDWAGHEARLKFDEPIDGARQVSGVIEGVDGDKVRISTTKGLREIPFNSIAAAKLLLTDELIKATAPLDADGADLIKMEG